MNILITGGTGSLGHALLKRIYGQHNITILSRDETKQGLTRSEYPNCRYILGDVANLEDLELAFRNIDVVYHMAAYKQVPSAQNNVNATIKTNIIGSKNVALAAIKNNVKQVVATSTDKACLDGDCRILLGDGTTERIRDLVKNKYTGDVVTYDENKREFTTSRVIGWYTNERDDRELFKISYDYAKNSNTAKYGPIVTEDHLILTNFGWKRADSLFEDDVLTYERTPNKHQMQVIVGSLLGDGFISKPKTSGQRPYMHMVHKEEDKEWLQIKVKALNGLNFSPIRESIDNTFGSKSARVDSNRYAFLSFLRNEFYNDHTKHVPYNLVADNFTPLMVATWYMDDGYMTRNGTAYIYTNGFSKTDVEVLAKLFNKHYIPADVVEQNGYYVLYFNGSATSRLMEYISPYIVPCMRKKRLNNQHYNFEYDESLWDIGGAVPYYGEVIVESVPEAYYERQSVYCLDVENTHNFVANGVVVHNCAPVNMYGISKAAMECIFQDANKYGPTTFHLARYGNVVASNASVVPLFKRQAKVGGPLTVTHADMTRFWISIDTAVDLVQHALTVSPGIIVVPAAKAMNIVKVAKLFGDDLPIKVTGIRPGEKIHESMVSEAESFYTEEYNHAYDIKNINKLFYIHPHSHSFRNDTAPFSYTSDKCPTLTPNEFLEMV